MTFVGRHYKPQMNLTLDFVKQNVCCVSERKDVIKFVELGSL